MMNSIRTIKCKLEELEKHLLPLDDFEIIASSVFMLKIRRVESDMKRFMRYRANPNKSSIVHDDIPHVIMVIRIKKIA